MTLRSASVAVLAAVPIALAGCSQGAPSAPSSASPTTAPPTAAPTTAAPSRAPGKPGSESVAWTNRLCELIGGFAASQQSAPPVDKSNRDAFKSSLVAQLDSALQAADDTLTGLRKIQPSPIKGGDGVTDAFEKSFVRAHDILSTAKTKAEHIDTSDQESFTAGQQAVQKEVKKGQSVFGSAFSRFNENRALLEAAAEAPACKPLTNPSSQVPRTSQQPPQ